MLFLVPPAQVEAPPAPAPVPFDMAGALARAKAENPLIRAAKARVDERQGLITSVRADALPQMSLIGDFSRVRDVSILNSGFGEAAAGFGLDANSLVAPRNLWTTSAVATQPLFYWGKIGTAIDIAKMGATEASYAYTTAELEILHGVARAYIAVLMTQADLEVEETRRLTAERFLADVKAKLEAQTATELDRLRAESELLGVIPETLKAEAAYKRAIETFNGQLGLDPKTPIKLSDLGMPDLKASIQGVERSEIAQYRKQEEMLRANDAIIKSDLRPKFDLTASYGYQAGKTDNLFQTPYDTWRVNVSMRFPVFDGLRSSGKRAQNRAQLEQVRQMRIDKEHTIAVERSTAERELELARAYHEAALKAYDAGLESLRMSRESFDQGLITSLDLLIAERNERTLESQRRRSALALWAALFNHRRALGLPPL